MKRLFIIAGELSGDTHGAGLMRELVAQEPEIKFLGLGGPQMKAQAGGGIEDWVENAAVVGLVEPLKRYGFFKERFEACLEAIREEKPDAVILVDYPGFNLRLAKAIRQQRSETKIIYYISPQVWAWKKGRIRTMAQVLDLMICIFPFEKPLYEKSGLKTQFAGHPMVDRVQSLRRPWPREKGLVGWFPGSREDEVRRLFPVMMKAAEIIKQAVPGVRFAVSAANEVLAGQMRELADQHQCPQAKRWIETGTVYDLMQRCEVGTVASGTATLEAACFGMPYALVYRIAWPTYVIGKLVVRIKHLGIVNILAGKEVVPEFIQHDCTPEMLATQMLRWLQDDASREQLQKELAETVAMLGEGGAYRRAAEEVLKEL
ncbi:MAG: lipid-A-disaccharide synthase [Verrucomicrobiaceae bacterium]|nr:lipid-A-disaccharide synthase [Verrucomicrobiaceae bacterium]